MAANFCDSAANSTESRFKAYGGWKWTLLDAHHKRVRYLPVRQRVLPLILPLPATFCPVSRVQYKTRCAAHTPAAYGQINAQYYFLAARLDRGSHRYFYRRSVDEKGYGRSSRLRFASDLRQTLGTVYGPKNLLPPYSITTDERYLDDGVNGDVAKHEMSPDNGKGLAAIPRQPVTASSSTEARVAGPVSTSINDLPEDEMQHITAEIMPLNVLLMRLAQRTYLSFIAPPILMTVAAIYSGLFVFTLLASWYAVSRLGRDWRARYAYFLVISKALSIIGSSSCGSRSGFSPGNLRLLWASILAAAVAHTILAAAVLTIGGVVWRRSLRPDTKEGDPSSTGPGPEGGDSRWATMATPPVAAGFSDDGNNHKHALL
ncbi:hypothetical protein B0T26DRAFT_756921 [Lasiosphaeria miniovina]|uniref:Uncharacterized protein n=1 Tax=Lasiosphaeria miniovina TaxID=1954250 RepID=A0AA39ZTQ9_9PEZI|nr:uncharacterized protein B0T26DRAFT_756921 [Lasiosphaeria miniovina]KAK0703360.1 hypothetical protein B0T26DRAFT_756921 [Lasiosphaeria miniovina]